MAEEIEHLLIQISAEDDATAELTGLEAALAAIERSSATAEVDVDTGGATAELTGFVAALEALDGMDVDVNVDLDAGLSQLELFTKKLEGLASTTFKGQFFGGGGAGAFTQFTDQQLQMDVDVDSSEVTRAQAQLAAMSVQMSLLDKQDVDINVNVDRDRLGGFISALAQLPQMLKGATEGIFSLVSSGKGLAGVGTNVAEAFSGMTVNIGSFGARLGPVVAGVIALVAVIGTALVGVLGALAAGLAGAAVFAGGLAIALGGVLAPMAIAAIPAFMSLSKIMKVFQQEQKDSAQSAQQMAQADRDAVLFARQRADAERNLADALKDVAQTEKQSAQQIADARRQEQMATENLRSATVDAYREMRDAIEAVEDAQLSLERAQLSKESAALGVKEALAQLKNFRKETNMVGSSFDDMFKKFTDVASKEPLQAIVGQAKGAGATDLSGDNALKLQRLVLGVKDARLREKEAIDGVDDAQTKLNDTQKVAADFLKNGINASDRYRAALAQVEEARRQVTRTEESAATREAQALQRVADARRQLRRLNEDRQFQIQQANLQKSDQMTQNLTASERGLLDAFKDLWATAKEVFGPVTQALIGGLAEGLGKVGPALKKLSGPFAALGTAMGTGIQVFFDTITSPAMLTAFQALIVGAAQLAPTFGRVFGDVLLLVLQLAQGALPFLISTLQTFSGFLSGLLGGGAAGKFHDLMASLEGIFYAVVDAIATLGPPFLALLVALAPYAQQLFEWIAGIARKLTAWLDSAEGRAEIKNFFEVAIPLAQRFASFVGKVIEFLIRLTEVFGPFITTTFDFVNSILDVVNTAAHLISVVTTAVGSFTSEITGMIASSIDALTGWIDDFIAMGKALIQGLIDGVKGMAGDAVDAITDIPGSAIDKVAGILGLGSPSKVFHSIGVDIGRGLEIGINATARRVEGAAQSSLAGPVLAAGAGLGVGGGAGGGVTIQKQDVHLPPAPGHDQLGDPRVQAEMFAREMIRRGYNEIGAPA